MKIYLWHVCRRLSLIVATALVVGGTAVRAQPVSLEYYQERVRQTDLGGARLAAELEAARARIRQLEDEKKSAVADLAVARHQIKQLEERVATEGAP